MIAVTQDAVRKRLAVEEAEQMASGTAYVLHEEISASQLITLGLDFEEQQYVRTVTFRSPKLTHLKAPPSCRPSFIGTILN